MLKSACAALALLAAAPAFAQPAAPAPAPGSLATRAPLASQATPSGGGLHTASLTVDSPLRDLVLDPRTRPVIEKHMPGFADRIETDPELAERFGGISLSGLQLDPHARGMTPAILARIGAELAEAQTPS
jgi:hypothetical protein